MNESERPWEVALPIRARPGEIYNHENDTFYAVGRIIAAINADPTAFKFILVETLRLAPQVAGRGNLDLGYIGSLSADDAARPILLGGYPDGSVRLLDGYHRTARAMQFGWGILGAWILTPEQTAAITLSADEAAEAERF